MLKIPSNAPLVAIKALQDAGHEIEAFDGVDAVRMVDESITQKQINSIVKSATPEAEADAMRALASKKRLDAVKAECKRRIVAVASPEAQANIATMGGAASSDKDIAAGAAAGIEWVQSMIATASALAADSDADYLADAAWPKCPPEAASLYDRF